MAQGRHSGAVVSALEQKSQCVSLPFAVEHKDESALSCMVLAALQQVSSAVLFLFVSSITTSGRCLEHQWNMPGTTPECSWNTQNSP